MKRCGKPLTSNEYNDSRREFLAEFNKKKLSERKGYFKEGYRKIEGSFAV